MQLLGIFIQLNVDDFNIKHLKTKKCWGYEKTCAEKHRMSIPECAEDSRGWTRTKEDQVKNFWTSADFGYVKERLGELRYMCEPNAADDSSLKCTKYTRYCYGTNVYMDFSESKIKSSTKRYREDLFKQGQIGGHCKMYADRLREEGEHKSPLQSWYAELQEFASLPFHPLRDNKCDIVIDKPTIVMKLDAGVNMFHHFCDFVNLYVAQHINNTFSTDVNIIMWDTSGSGYGDFFSATWKAFTDHSIVHLKEYDGKKVCFRDLMFPLLPRMRYGLYYNMPLIPGCKKSGMLRAFSQHVLHRLNATQEGPLRNKIRVTLLSRGSMYRNILNEDELANGLKTIQDYEVKLVRFDRRLPFIDQLKVTQNSDIFIGMHGAGLTHLLFQPDWGVIFELYNCEDTECYKDLARLRGLHYITWERREKLIQEDEGHHPTLGAHAKFTNYSFDLREFLRLIEQAADYVRNSPSYKQAWTQHYGSKDEL
ncbi:EGF domain-specific O-linked N-acetylglucosamine transferase [Lamellibrachia satsuma]|nr:EGF domain-specific O-linked N-acetylglucosamine transferase [Lamellibrachia satsuma]